uniref:Uncharacterized protein n=1 Tax=Anguilla anguilla TaxID=7936 RepID=A0A0E9PVS1_ANGAN
MTGTQRGPSTSAYLEKSHRVDAFQLMHQCHHNVPTTQQ